MAISSTSSGVHPAPPRRIDGRLTEFGRCLMPFPIDRFAMRKSASLKRRAGW